MLRHILQSPDHGLRIAVIVNDMASVNVDANLVSRGNNKNSNGEIRLKEKVVQMENGETMTVRTSCKTYADFSFRLHLLHIAKRLTC